MKIKDVNKKDLCASFFFVNKYYNLDMIISIVEGKGTISHNQAVKKAEKEYEKYKVIQDRNYVSDFDKLMNETRQIENK